MLLTYLDYFHIIFKGYHMVFFTWFVGLAGSIHQILTLTLPSSKGEEEQIHNNSIYDNDKQIHIYIVLIYMIRTLNTSTKG